PQFRLAGRMAPVTALLTHAEPQQVAVGSGAASVAIHSLITGRTRPVAVLAEFPSAIYLATAPGAVVALVSKNAVRLPCAVVLGDEAGLSEVGDTAGHEASVGAGAIVVGRLRVEVARWWRPSPPAPPSDPAVLSRGVEALGARMGVQQHRLLRAM